MPTILLSLTHLLFDQVVLVLVAAVSVGPSTLIVAGLVPEADLVLVSAVAADSYIQTVVPFGESASGFCASAPGPPLGASVGAVAPEALPKILLGAL